MQTNEISKIKVLPPEEARRIAAGEVIDRPAALVREFLDNAIDALSLSIDVSIEEGGCKKVEISDNGSGMSRDDLELCHLTHATSKIRGLDDLDTALTLGFRGEALAAASAVSRLEIITSTDGREAWKLESGPGESFRPKVEQTHRSKGTTARALNLFESIPARKRFLKREGSEGILCRQAFIDKALAFNTINFKFFQDGKLKDFFPAVRSKKERFASALLETGEENFLHEINLSGEVINNAGFSVTVVIGSPELYRNDRRQLFVFANGRRINDYALIQAVEYGSQGWFPNGAHPVGAVYVDIDPSLADFNIHPAKREARFRDAGAIHHVISGGVKNFFHTLFLKNSRTSAQEQREEFEFSSRGSAQEQMEEFEFSSRRGAEAQREKRDLGIGTREWGERIENISNYKNIIFNISNPQSPTPSPNYGEPKYAGRAFGLFILIEHGDKLYLIDQHAAHERILFDKFLESPIPKQELLTPILFCAESDDDDAFLETKREEFSRLGLIIERDEGVISEKGWRIEALPADWRMSDCETIKEILSLKTAGENIARRWVAAICCRAAIKDGDYPDDETAFALGKEALALREPRCPHGRPIWTEISKEALLKAVRRE